MLGLLSRQSSPGLRWAGEGVFASGLRLFHRSTVARRRGTGVNDVNKKKVKLPMPRAIRLAQEQLKRESLQQRTEELRAKFEAIRDRPVIHWKPPVLQAWVVSLQNEPVGIVPLNRDVWGQQVRPDIVHRIVRWQRAAWRQGTHKAKNRGEKRGGGRKPRPQKGTGQSRQGSNRSPLYLHGGKAHPPVPRSHAFKLPRKVVNLGLRIALSAKYAEGNLFVIKDTMLDSHKTAFLHNLLQTRWSSIAHNLIAVVHSEEELDPNFALAAKSLPNLDFYTPRTLNVYDVVKRFHLLITESALTDLEAKLLGQLQSKVKFAVESPPEVKLKSMMRISVPKFRRKQRTALRLKLEKEERAENKKLFA